MATDKVVISFEGADSGGSRVIEAIQRNVQELAQAFRVNLTGAVRQAEQTSRQFGSAAVRELRQLQVESHVAAQGLAQALIPAIHGVQAALTTMGAQQAAVFQAMVARNAAAAAAIERRSVAMASRVRAAFAALPGLGAAGGGLLARGGEGIGGALSGLGGTLGGLFGGGIGGGTNPFTGILQSALGMIQRLVPEIVRLAQGALGAVTDVLAALPNMLGSVLSSIPTGIGQVLGAGFKLFGGFVQGVGGVLQGLVGIAGGVFQAVATVAGTALNGLLTVATKIVGGVADAFGSLVGTVAGIFGKVASTAALGMAAVLGVATFKSVELRTKLANTFALIADDLEKAGPKGAQAIRRSFADIARSTLADAGNLKWADVGEAIYSAVGSGFRSAAEARPIVLAAAQATVAGGEKNPAAMVLALVKAMTQFEIPASRAQEVADKFFQTVNYGIITIGQLAEAFPGVGAIARAAGLSMEEALTLVAEGSKRLDLETTSSGLQQFLQAVAHPDEGALKARKALGIPTEQLSPEQAKLTEELQASISKAEKFIDTTTRMEKTTHAQRVAVKDARAELKRLQEQLELVRQAGQSVNALDFLRELKGRDLSFAQLSEVVGGRIQAARFAAAFTGGQASKDAGVKPGQGAGLDNFADTLEKIQKESAGAVARGAAEVKRSLGFNVEQVFTNIGLLWDTVVGRIEERSAEAWPQLHAGFDGFRTSVEEWVASGQLDEFFEGIAATAGQVFAFLGDALKGLTWEDFKRSAQDAWGVVSTLAKATWEAAKLAASLATTIMHADLTGSLGGAWDWVKDKAEEVWTAIVGLSQGDTTGFAAIFRKLEGFFLQVLGNVLQVVGDIVDAVVEAAAVAVEKVGGFGAKFYNVMTLGIPALLGHNPVDNVEGASRSIRSGKGGIGELGRQLEFQGLNSQAVGERMSGQAADNVRTRSAQDSRREAEEALAAESAKRAARNLEGLAAASEKAEEAMAARAAAEREAASKPPQGWHSSPEAALAATRPEGAPKSKSEEFLDGIEEEAQKSNAKLDQLVELGEQEARKVAAEQADKAAKKEAREDKAERSSVEQELRRRGVKVPKAPGEHAGESTEALLEALGLQAGALQGDPTNPYTLPEPGGSGRRRSRDGYARGGWDDDEEEEDGSRRRRKRRQNRPNFSRPFSGPNNFDKGMSGSAFGLFSKAPRLVEREETSKPWWSGPKSETEIRKQALRNVKERIDQARRSNTPLTTAGGPLGQLGQGGSGNISWQGPEVRSFQAEKERIVQEEIKRLREREKAGSTKKSKSVTSPFSQGWEESGTADPQKAAVEKADRMRRAERLAKEAGYGKKPKTETDPQAKAVADEAKRRAAEDREKGIARAGGPGGPVLVDPVQNAKWKAAQAAKEGKVPEAAAGAPAAPAAPPAAAPPTPADAQKGGFKAAMEQAAKARQAVVDELKAQAEAMAQLGKDLAESDGKLLEATKEAGKATTDVLKAHGDRLAKVEAELQEQRRSREGLAAVSGEGSGV